MMMVRNAFCRARVIRLFTMLINKGCDPLEFPHDIHFNSTPNSRGDPSRSRLAIPCKTGEAVPPFSSIRGDDGRYVVCVLK